MKYKSLFLFFILICFSLNCNAESADGNPKNMIKKIKISTPDSISQQANKYTTGPTYDGEISPIVNSTLNGFGNMIQSMNGGYYGGEEQVRHQMDYARQQMGEW
ncbi:MAG: hypothetical protein PHC64_10610 [Candidatus Gastranaerophilales bacterium]|nr:hypothetical protein [Candidatus Gastranaerophilales bacterium]